MTKTFATAAVIATLSAPAFAEVEDAREHFAQGEDSAAERIVPDVESVGTEEAKLLLREQLDDKKAAVLAPDSNVSAAQEAETEDMISQYSDSAAEIED
jgi:hypothetical protein